jgi:hypothetical protein
MTENFRSAIQSLCKSPNLTTLYLDNVDGFPITVIAACPNLRHLHLWYAELDVNLFFFSCTFTTTKATFQFDGADLTDETSRLQPPPHMDSLEIDHDTLVCPWPDDYRSFAKKFCSRLRNLQIKSLFCSVSVMNFGWDIIFSAAQTQRLSRHSIFWKVGFALTLHRGYDGCAHDKCVLDDDEALRDLLELWKKAFH